MNEKMLEMVQGAEPFYPHLLEKQFPRVFSKIIELWDTPQFEAYLLNLIVDDRGDRQGFSKEVAAEIYRLGQVYERTHCIPKTNDDPWANVNIERQHEVERSGYLFTPQGFLKSVEAGDEKVINLFLGEGIDLNMHDERGWTPLMISSFNGKEEIAQLLIRKGADVNAKDHGGYGPLHWASFNGYICVIRLLLHKRADPDARSNFGWTPLMQAATRGHLVACGLLIGMGASVNLTSKDGWTAMHKATANGHLEIVKLLLSKGADPGMQYQDGSTALSIATKNKNEAIIALLKARDYPIN